MGRNQAWVAFKTRQPLESLKTIGLVPTGRTAAEDYSDVEFPAWGTMLPSGWYFVQLYAGDEEPEAELLRRVSEHVPVVTRGAFETAMISTAARYADGRQVWSIRHEGWKDVKHLKATGKLPECYATIRKARRKEQRLAHYDAIFQIPHDVIEVLTGFDDDRITDYADDLLATEGDVQVSEADIQAFLAHCSSVPRQFLPRSSSANDRMPAAIGVYEGTQGHPPARVTERAWSGVMQAQNGAPSQLGETLLQRVEVLDGDLTHFVQRFVNARHGWVDLSQGERGPRVGVNHASGVEESTFCYVFDVPARRLDVFATHREAAGERFTSIAFDSLGTPTPSSFPPSP